MPCWSGWRLAIRSAGGTVDELAAIDPQLEDVFIELAERQT